MKTELINLEKMQLQPGELFRPKGLESLLAQIETEARALVPDVSTAKGRRAIASNAMRIPRSKTYLDGLGKDLTAGLKNQTKAVDVERKAMRDRLDKLRDEVRQPLTEWEEAEKARVDALRKRVEQLRLLANDNDTPYSAAELKNQLGMLKAIPVDESFEELEADAAIAKNYSIQALEKRLERQTAYEEEQDELARLREEAEERARDERAERIRQEAASHARLEAEARAREEAGRVERERQAEAQRQEQARMDAVRREQAAERRALDAEQRRQRESEEAEHRSAQLAENAAREERERIDVERREEKEAAIKREHDKSHAMQVNEAAAAALTTFGLDVELAMTVVVAVRLGQIPHMNIKY